MMTLPPSPHHDLLLAAVRSSICSPPLAQAAGAWSLGHPRTPRRCLPPPGSAVFLQAAPPAQPQGLCTDTLVSTPNSCPWKAFRAPSEGAPHCHCGGRASGPGSTAGPASLGRGRRGLLELRRPLQRPGRPRWQDSVPRSTSLAPFLRTPHASSLPVSSCVPTPPRGGTGEAPRPDAHPSSSQRDLGDRRQVNAERASEGMGPGAGRAQAPTFPSVLRDPPLCPPTAKAPAWPSPLL